MDNKVFKVPVGAKIDFETGEMTLLFREGTKAEFVAAMRGVMRAASALEVTESACTEQKAAYS